MKVNKKDNDVLNWERLAVLFDAKSVREMSVEEYEAEFDTKFPVPVQTPKPARTKVVDPWIKVAEKILERDFCEEPIDRSTKDSWVIGLRTKTEPSSKAALTKLKQTKPLLWGKKDKAVGTLLPRRKRINNRLTSEAARNPESDVPAAVVPASFLPPCSEVRC